MSDSSAFRAPQSRTPFALLSLLIVLGALLRLDFLMASGPVLDGDEAIVGLMAKHIGEGRPVPVFYYGQHYMGSLEAILAAASFKAFGTSALTLQLVPFVWSLFLIPLVYALGSECASRRAGLIAALFTTVPPVSLVVWSSKARGGFIEIVVLCAVALLLCARWIRRDIFSTHYAFGIGLTTGLGWWVNNQILYAMVPIALMAGSAIALRIVHDGRPLSALLRATRVVVVGLTAFFIGSSPYWIYNIERGFPSLGMFSRASLSEMLDHGIGLFSTALPILMGSKHFWETNPTFPGAAYVYYSLYALLFVAILAKKQSGFTWGQAAHSGLLLVTLFITLSCAIFVSSSFGWLVQAPRYLLPIYVGIFVLLGTGIDRLAMHSRPPAFIACAAILALNVMSCYHSGRVVPGQPIVYAGQRVSFDHQELIAKLDALGIRHVRTNYWIGYRLAFESNERITFRVFQEPEQVRIPEYQKSLPDEDMWGLPFVLVPAQAPLVERALSILGYTFDLTKASGYVVIYNLKRELPAVKPVDAAVIDDVRATGPQNPKGALDGALDTRWGSGAHQQKGQEFRVHFSKPVPLVAIGYLLGSWLSDYPRGLQIQVERVDGEIQTVLDPSGYDAMRYLTGGDDSVEIVMPRTEVRSIILTQTGQDPVFDWSIGELLLFQSTP